MCEFLRITWDHYCFVVILKLITSVTTVVSINSKKKSFIVFLIETHNMIDMVDRIRML